MNAPCRGHAPRRAKRFAPSIAGVATLALLLALGACSNDEAAAPEDARPIVVVSVLPQKYAVDRIAGNRVRVAVMLPPGANPATHEPTLDQLLALSRASLYAKVGHPNFPFERAWLDRILAEHPTLPIVDASAGIAKPTGDPHVWVAPQHMKHMAIELERALAQILPSERAALSANLARFVGEIDRLDLELRHALLGSKGRPFFVVHPAWGAFAAAYGLEQIAIEEDHKEPSVTELAALLARARAAGARAVFVQPQFSTSAANTIAGELGARVESIDPLAYEWPETLRRFAAAIADSAR